ncbi:MAG: hypothetical protein PHW34_03605 [Hespellia sp.]|nr:hypothetical protein [Hespellia sp.]
MANTLDDLYYKYIDQVGKTMENDRYFQYLFTMIQAGTNVIQQKHRILNKVVDERWIATIEDSLDAINTIIEKPRRFIATTEEVVPVSLAKKITADSVRHLSMNTQFIANSEEGEIHPSKILNVTTEESFDLYENRFIYHLISRLIAFVDKRTDVIFWSTNNETSNVFSLESSVDDAYEQINYKVEMSIKNTQSLVENDNDNMQVFMRIDRLRRLVFSLRGTAFYSLMSGCAKVRSPIQRTNLMMKDPNYRACYKLWQFLESYDEVGYTIVPEDSTLQFDEEYLIQIYTNMIANYTVFKSILESDDRDVLELQKKRRRARMPKFIKQIKEEQVDSPDLPDVEVRKIFVEEVTQGQLDAEAKLEEEKKRFAEEVRLREEVEESEAEAQRQIQGLYQQISAVMAEQAEVEEELDRVKQEKNDEIEALEIQVEGQKNQFATEVEAQKNQFEEQIKQQKNQFEEQIEQQKNQFEEQIGQQRQGYETKISKMITNSEAQMKDIIEAHHAQLSGMEQNYEKQIDRLKRGSEEQLASLQKEKEEQLGSLQKAKEEQLTVQEQAHQKQLEELKKQYEADHENEINQLTEEYGKRIQQLEQQVKKSTVAQKQAENRMRKAEKAKQKAQEHAEGTRLSRYIISSLSGKNKQPEENDKKDEN